MKPIVCITPSLFKGPDPGHELINMKYTRMLRLAGAIPIMCDYTEDPTDVGELLGLCRGIVLTGGYDIDPARYGEERLEGTDEPPAARDATEFELARQALERDMPVLAVCRGLQILNVLAGGTLWQDVNAQGATQEKHSAFDDPNRKIHDVLLVPGTPIADAVGAERIVVNSCHHQAIKDLGPELEVAATSPDGLVEAAWMPGHRFVWGVQWHPESLYTTCPEDLALAQAFVEACRG